MPRTAPLNAIDIEKCKALHRNLERTGFDMLELEFTKADTGFIDDPLAALDGRTENRATACLITGNNGELEEALNNPRFKNKGLGSAWATAFSMKITRDGIEESDIPINLASCDIRGDMRLQNLVLGLPRSCKVEALHTHNKLDKNAAVHIHLRCDDNSSETMDAVEKFLANTKRVGEYMCKPPKRY